MVTLKQRIKAALIVVLVLLLPFELPGNNTLFFRRISPPEGLNFQSIHSITQDDPGNIWMASNQGIYKYNSNGFTWYHHQPSNPTSLCNDAVYQVLPEINNVWVASASGLDLFDATTQTFQHFEYSHNDTVVHTPTVLSIGFDQAGHLWLIDNYGLGKLDRKQKKITYLHRDVNGFTPRLLYFDAQHRAWVGTFDGAIYRLHTDDGKLVKVTAAMGSEVRAIFAEGNRLIVGYQASKACTFTTDGQLQQQHEQTSDGRYNLGETSVRSIIKDSLQRIWLATYRGLFILTEHELTRYQDSPNNELPNHSFYSVFQDRAGGIWCGTWSGGLFYSHSNDNRISHYSHDKAPTSISNNVISSFCELPSGSFFVGTERGGLNRFDKNSGTFIHIPLGSNNESDNIKALAADNEGNLWVGTFSSGIWVINKGNSRPFPFSLYCKQQTPPVIDRTYAFAPCPTGMWIGSFEQGLFFYEYASRQCLRLSDFLPGNSFTEIRHLFIDSNNRLWVGSNRGLRCIELNDEYLPVKELVHHQTGPVFYIDQLQEDQLWIGTKAGGILRLNLNDISELNNDNRFSDKDIYGFIKDAEGFVWITTNTGLYQYNVKTSAVRQFNKVDGIQGNQFNPQAIYKDAASNLYFGGTHGFNVIAPQAINTNQRPPKVFIDQMLVNNAEVYHLQYNALSRGFDAITLHHDQNSFRISYADDSYLLSAKNQYKYRLKGMFDEWITNNDNKVATFTNIPPGNYVFEVAARNNDGIWSTANAQLTIHILKPWWLTNVSLALYALIIASISYLIYSTKKEQIKLKKAVFLERMTREKEDQLHEMKLRFFTNISHEIRTPLTLITGPIKVLLNDPSLPPEATQKLGSVERNTNRLLRLVNQILDFRKAEHNKAQLQLTTVSLEALLSECKGYFQQEATDKQIHIEIENHITETLVADEEKLRQTFINLIGNAMKHSPNGRTINIKATQNKTNLSANYSATTKIGNLAGAPFVEVCIEDYGDGIPSNSLPNIFKRFETGDAKGNGSGIGLSICSDFITQHNGEIEVGSTPSQGSSFCVRIPLEQSYQAPDLLENNHLHHIDPLPVVQLPQLDDTAAYSVLIVEDNPDMRAFIQQIIEPHFSVEVAEDGEQALAKISEQKFDLIISDVMMPKVNGLDLCKHLKSSIEFSHIPVILLTALSSHENTLTGLSYGADAYLSKPFDQQMLLMRVYNLLRQREYAKKAFTEHLQTNSPIQAFDGMDNYFISKTKRLIEQHIDDTTFGVEQLSDKLAISRGHLHRKVKQLTGFSPNELIRNIRLQQAAELLLKEDSGIEQIAFQVGFSSASYFAKCFKSFYQLTPKEYVTKHAN